MAKEKSFHMVDMRLKEWGFWFVKSLVGGLGAPGQSTLVTALQGSRSTAPFYPKDNSYAEEVNAVINDMRSRHPRWANIVNIEYTNAGHQKDKADHAGVSLKTYKIILNNGLAWIDARLS